MYSIVGENTLMPVTVGLTQDVNLTPWLLIKSTQKHPYNKLGNNLELTQDIKC